MTTHATPPMIGSRIERVDALRGLALLGIILANVPYAPGLSEIHSDTRYIIGSPSIENMLQVFSSIFIDKKFIPIFSILFGFGFSVQLSKIQGSRSEFNTYFRRRMLLLFLIGCMHGYLLWFGDITRNYALCGLLLLVVYKWPLARILWLALILSVPATALVYILNAALNLQQYGYDVSMVKDLYLTDNYLRYLQINATIDPLVNFLQDSPITLVFCSGQILLGFWLGQTGFFYNPGLFKSRIRTWILFGSTFGVLGSVGLWAITTGKIELSGASAGLIFLVVGGLVLQSLFYVALFVKLYHYHRWRRLLGLFIPVGKMALTNYLMQTVFCLLFFFHWPHALQLYGKVTLTETYLIALCIFGFQTIYSHWWFEHFTQGPVEMLWKKLAYRNVATKHTEYIHH
ncbi:DUF418 domain-containing protein [Rhodocytophaga aerolata]|uniref:DUF418 domain-containing protein n=1 Tax=Rhodocytophaga aerolata TaxID=455078 RepID=A0ABT8RGH2_9BACT|nr:DUF418 domain-containing protein [Rhodocytophaga aerolata]MDO1451201.1 DUF418 domain-containing protein [Rhodocytophaga aerolata]